MLEESIRNQNRQNQVPTLVSSSAIRILGFLQFWVAPVQRLWQPWFLPVLTRPGRVGVTPGWDRPAGKKGGKKKAWETLNVFAFMMQEKGKTTMRRSTFTNKPQTFDRERRERKNSEGERKRDRDRQREKEFGRLLWCNLFCLWLVWLARLSSLPQPPLVEVVWSLMACVRLCRAWSIH